MIDVRLSAQLEPGEKLVIQRGNGEVVLVMAKSSTQSEQRYVVSQVATCCGVELEDRATG